MKDTVKIYKGGQAYLGRKAEQDGYIGNVERQFNAVTMTLIKPGTPLEEVKHSLEITIRDIELRIREVERKSKEK